jgi:hypothetical protein
MYLGKIIHNQVVTARAGPSKGDCGSVFLLMEGMGNRSVIIEKKNTIREMKYIKIFHSALSFDFKRVTVMVSVKGCLPLVNIFLRLVRTFGKPQNFPSTVRVIISMLKTFWMVQKSQGVKGLVLYLKVHYVILQQAVSGYKIEDLTPLGVRVSRSKTGIPRCIPAGYRARVAAGEVFPIRVCLTLFSLYRVLTFPGITKIHTITSPYGGLPGHKLNYLFNMTPVFLRTFVPWDLLEDPYGEMKRSGKSMATWALVDRENFPITKSGPASSVVSRLFSRLPNSGTYASAFSSSHPFVAIASALALCLPQNKGLLTSLLYLSERTTSVASHTRYFLSYCQELITLGGISLPNFMKSFPKGIPLGKIGLKTEAAGKVRVFAMVDCWSQWTLYPLHAFIFRILKHHKDIDGTFDQLNPIERLLSTKPKFLASLDLSAATDRLPISIQMRILNELFQDNEFGAHWANLLVSRGYLLPKVGYIKYAVGQPMGGYSSWAMLALTHHFIVQVSAWLSGVTPKGVMFKDYAILGDDCVIANRRVADQYLQIMKDLGVSCGLAKSILSPAGVGLEFAKRTFVLGHNVSPISLQDFSWVTRKISSAVQFATIHHLSLSRWLSVLGYGYKVLANINKPFNKMSGTLRTLVLTYKFQQLGSNYFNFLQLRSVASDFKTLPTYLIYSFLLSEGTRLKGVADRAEDFLLKVSRNAFSSGSLWNHPMWWSQLTKADVSYLSRLLYGKPGYDVSYYDRYLDKSFALGLTAKFPGLSAGVQNLLLEAYVSHVLKVYNFSYFLSDTFQLIRSNISGIMSQTLSFDKAVEAITKVENLLEGVPLFNPLGFNAHDKVEPLHQFESITAVKRYNAFHKAVITGKVTNKVLYGGFPIMLIFRFIWVVLSKALAFKPFRKILISLPALRLLVLMMVFDAIISASVILLVGFGVWVAQVGFSGALTITLGTLSPWVGVLLAMLPVEIKDLVIYQETLWALIYPYIRDVIYGTAAGSATYLILSLYQDKEIIWSSYQAFATLVELQEVGPLDGGLALWVGYGMALSQDLFKQHILEPVILPWLDVGYTIIFSDVWFSESTKLIASHWFSVVPLRVLGVILLPIFGITTTLGVIIASTLDWLNEYQVEILMFLLGLG